jgi:putative restriction endonuclease
MQGQELKQKIDSIRMWQRGGERAPHKPLLILYALSRLAKGAPRLVAYEEVVDDLKKLLKEFGPYRQTYSPSYPFVRLVNDGIWKIEGQEPLKTNKDWTDRELISNQTAGGFTEKAYNILKDNKALIVEIASKLLNLNFPDTLHEDILTQVGLDLDLADKRQRSPDFRLRVLNAYEYRCAVCGFNVRLGDTLIAVEAAHIKWHQAGGPDSEVNGIALCSMHHKLFDRGVFTLTDNLTFQVAEQAHGTSGMEEWLLKYHGQQIRKPQRPDYYPKDNYIDWHVREVFRGPARYSFS